MQHWANEGEFHTGGFVLCNFIEPVTLTCCVTTSLMAVGSAGLEVLYTWIYIYIIESVDISRDERDVPLMQYITNA